MCGCRSGRLALSLPLPLGRRCRLLLLRFWVDSLAQCLAIVQAEHHDDDARLFARQHLLDGLRPFDGLAARVIADETGEGPDLAHHADLGRVRERLF